MLLIHGRFLVLGYDYWVGDYAFGRRRLLDDRQCMCKHQIFVSKWSDTYCDEVLRLFLNPMRSMTPFFE